MLVDENTDRDRVIKTLEQNGIDARSFFYPLSDMDIYKKYSHSNNPVAKKMSSHGINLPTYESLKSIEEIGIIIEKIAKDKL